MNKIPISITIYVLNISLYIYVVIIISKYVVPIYMGQNIYDIMYITYVVIIKCDNMW